jgi:hypothetical protein
METTARTHYATDSGPCWVSQAPHMPLAQYCMMLPGAAGANPAREASHDPSDVCTATDLYRH